MGIYSDLTGLAVLDLLAGLSGRPVDLKRRRELQDRLGLHDNELRRTLSSRPASAALDKPTEGLDLLMQPDARERMAAGRVRW
jgi:ABC-type multidrug transport system ATPase subunit